MQRMKTAKLAALCILGFWLCASHALALEPGDKAPPFVNLDLSKHHVLSKHYLGKSWVILDFFATDCEGCKKEIPIIEQLYRDHSEIGLEVIVFATDLEGAEVVSPFFENRPTPLTVLLDHYQVTVKKYGVEEIPSLFLIDPQGSIVHKEVGYREDLYEVISSILGS
jgi:peroxiredoxin